MNGDFKNITIYLKHWCHFCQRALFLLKDKGIEPNIIDLEKNPEKLQSMIEKAGASTVPQIFAADEYVGDCSKLYQLEQEGKLDPILRNSLSFED